jgi:hypothetical protein
MFQKFVKIITPCLLTAGFTSALWAAEGDAYTWPTYSEDLNYNFRDAGYSYTPPTQDVNGSCIGTAQSEGGVYHGEYWAFYHGANKNSLVTEAAITPLLEKMDQDFSFITDSLGWPRDSRVSDGYYSAVYLYGSDECTGSNDPEATGGWQTHIDGYPAVTASYYPVYSFDPACTYNDKIAQQNAMVHEGIHAILTNLGAAHVHWFQEGGNTWLQQEMEVRRSNSEEHHGMGFLNVGNLMAPFVPIESYSGWLLDGSFGGPGAEGVDAGGDCNWRNTLGGVQYGNLFPTFLGLWAAEGAVAWIWVNIPNWNGEYILESMAAAFGGDAVRSIIMEYRAKLAMLDMKEWSEEMRTLLNREFGGSIGCEWEPCAVDNVERWTVTPYAVTTENNGILTPETRTTPGWSGANIIPLNLSSGTSQVKLSLQSVTSSMSLQIAYRGTDGVPVYSEPVFGTDTAVLNLNSTPQDNMVFAIICNTDYDYQGEVTRTTHHDYRLSLDEGIASAADPHTRWYNNFNVIYDWDSAKVVHTINASSDDNSSSTDGNSSIDESSSDNETSSDDQTSSSSVESTTLSYNAELPITNDYTGITLNVDLDDIAAALDISTSELSASMIQGVNQDGSLYEGNTANGDAGHWFAANGDVVSWNETTAYIFSEWNLSAGTVYIGHFPDKVLDGEIYVINQAFISGSKQVVVQFTISIGETTGLTVTREWRKDMAVSYKNGVITANYHVQNAGKVKIGIYTGYGALIRNVLNEYKSNGTYSQNINLESLNLPQGVYLIQLTYPGHSETWASVSSYK